MNLRTAVQQGAKLLEDGSVAVPRLTAEVLLCHAIGCERAYLFAHPEQELRELEWLHYGRYLHQRLQGTPTQYITQKQEFFGRDFRVSPNVLIPRPETEHLVEAALEVCGGAQRIVDVGTGSGAIAVTLALETGARVCATDLSERAMAVASANARELRANVDLVVCDLLSAIGDRSVDAVVSNPPYVPLGDKAGLQPEVRDWEPPLALFAGPTGFEVYERLVIEAARALRPRGWLLLELGFRASERVQQMLAGWRNLRIVKDLAGIDRVLLCQK